jgi:pimeloyl-ACP methyl ester carboxylesterase
MADGSHESATESSADAIPEAHLPQGTIRYRDTGNGEPLVFVHGFLTDGSLWRKVVPLLEPEFRCVVPDWPLGSHRPAMSETADLTPPGLAAIIAGFIGETGLGRVTLVGNDTGGAISQLVATRHPEVLERLVLTPCDAYDNFLPAMFRPLQAIARIPGSIWAIGQSLRVTALRHAPNAFGWLSKHGPDPEVTRAWLEPSLESREVRRDIAKILKGISNRYTLEAAERLRDFDRPTLIAWAPEDRFFKFRYAERLAEAIPDSRLERIEDSWTYVSEDQPQRTAELIGEFVRDTTKAATTSR